MLGVLFMFFGTIITVNMFLAWFAVDSWSGLVAKNGYVASIDFDGKEKEVERQNKLGWKSRLKLNGTHVIFSIKDKSGAPITDLTIVGTIGRPTTEVQDQVLEFHNGNPGEYIASVNIAAGQWDVAIQTTSSNNEHYKKLYRLIKKPGK